MKLKLLFFALLFLAACSSYNNEDIVALIDGHEIKVKDVLTQYPINEKNIEKYIQEEAIIIKAKKLGIKVDLDEIQSLQELFYPSLEDVENTKFYERQAKALGITAEEYFDIWSKEHLIRNAYMQEYISNVFGFPTTSHPAFIEAWEEQFEAHVEALLAQFEYKQFEL